MEMSSTLSDECAKVVEVHDSNTCVSGIEKGGKLKKKILSIRFLGSQYFTPELISESDFTFKLTSTWGCNNASSLGGSAIFQTAWIDKWTQPHIEMPRPL